MLRESKCCRIDKPEIIARPLKGSRQSYLAADGDRNLVCREGKRGLYGACHSALPAKGEAVVHD